MTLVFAISIYVVIWWIVLFAMLPIGVRTPSRGGRGVPWHRGKRAASAEAAAEDAGHHGGREHGVCGALRDHRRTT